MIQKLIPLILSQISLLKVATDHLIKACALKLEEAVFQHVSRHANLMD